jgi:hypothetical protein
MCAPGPAVDLYIPALLGVVQKYPLTRTLLGHTHLVARSWSSTSKKLERCIAMHDPNPLKSSGNTPYL